MQSVSIIVPALDEQMALERSLERLQPMRARGCELIVVDGGSRDQTREIADALADRVLTARRGRARQMNEGAAAARGSVFWFLHADTLAPVEGDLAILAACGNGQVWGRFDVRLSGTHPALRVIETSMNWRSRLSGIATGDQGMFVQANLFSEVGGFPDIGLMEDIALSSVLKRRRRPACLKSKIVASSRRWERDGILRTVLTMWRIRLAYWLGEHPDVLTRLYYGRRS